jgi:hypothetical protein
MKINELALQNRNKFGKIRNPAATKNQIEQAYLLPSRKPVPAVPAGARLVR